MKRFLSKVRYFWSRISILDQMVLVFFFGITGGVTLGCMFLSYL